jgi:hypothetical protein
VSISTQAIQYDKLYRKMAAILYLVCKHYRVYSISGSSIDLSSQVGPSVLKQEGFSRVEKPDLSLNGESKSNKKS